MCKKHYTKLLLLACAALLEWTTSVGATAPKDLGYRRVVQNDEAVIALMTQRVLAGIAQNDPYLYQDFLASGYRDEASTRALSKSAIAVRAITTQFDAQKQEAVCHIPFSNGAGYAQLRFIKQGERWRIVSSAGLKQLIKTSSPAALPKTSDGSHALLHSSFNATNLSFINKELAPEHGLGILSRQITQSRLQRNLFGLPRSMALFAKVQQFDAAPFIAASYVQLVTDPAWNRIVYGDYQRWIKAYDGRDSGTPLNRPQGIAVDAQGRVYVADTDNGRVLVLQLTGPAENLTLAFVTELGKGELAQPSALAWDDGGTIFDNSDDVLWVIDRTQAALLAYQLHNAQQIVKYQSESLLDPVAIALGRFEGLSDGNLYVADAASRKVLRLFFDGEKLRHISAVACGEETVPTALATDHWGNVYLSDEAYRQIQKFSPSLELLTTLRAENENFRPLQFQTLFGTLELANAAQPQWSGYDQAFLLEHWTDKSGGRRYELGIDFELEHLRLSKDLSAVALAGKLTDPGYLKTELLAPNGAAVNALHAGWANAGAVELQYDRRAANGEMIAPGFYKLRHTLRSTYDKPKVVRESETFYLPLYYYEDCGANASHDAHLARGARVNRFGEGPEQTLATDDREVVYRFAGLNSNLRYETRATYVSAEGNVEQVLFGDESLLHEAKTISSNAQTTEWLEIPAQEIADGNLQLRFVKTSGSGPASVAEVWLREAHFDAAHPPKPEERAGAIPQAFALQQNYPNPFNPSTTITFTLPQDFRGVATLRIYNMLGEMVRELVQRDLSAGTYREVWDGLDASGRRMASGVYLYQLRAGSFASTKKLVMMK
ncbi:MAG: FlgD immunoglobulin-like domain containing protein [candidate division KSB1 bacterium]